MIHLLLKLEKNSKCFYGIKAIGNWDTPGLVRAIPSCIEGSDYRVTIETASLFLISAIYYEDLKFADPPILCEFSVEEKSCDEVGNTPQRIMKAWRSTKNWNKLLKNKGFSYLSKKGLGPLINSGLTFF